MRIVRHICANSKAFLYFSEGTFLNFFATPGTGGPPGMVAGGYSQAASGQEMKRISRLRSTASCSLYTTGLALRSVTSP